MNLQKMMKQAQQMQDMQAQMEVREFSGKAGGGVVEVIINGKGTTLSVSLDDSLMVKDEKEMFCGVIR